MLRRYPFGRSAAGAVLSRTVSDVANSTCRDDGRRPSDIARIVWNAMAPIPGC